MPKYGGASDPTLVPTVLDPLKLDGPQVQWDGLMLLALLIPLALVVMKRLQ